MNQTKLYLAQVLYGIGIHGGRRIDKLEPVRPLVRHLGLGFTPM